MLVAAAGCVVVWSLRSAEQGPAPGAPLAGITANELEQFRAGRSDFLEVENSEEGLGPLFNGTSCGQCHNIPAVGGTGTIIEIRAGYRDEAGVFHAPPGGTLMHLFSLPPHDCQVSVYEEANVVGKRISIPLFGSGLVEAIPDTTLLALEDPNDRNGDGIRGRAALVEDLAGSGRRVGRFGWKAQHATLVAFAADAYVNEMGVTSDLFPKEPLGNIAVEKGAGCLASRTPEDVPDVRTGLRSIDRFAHFLRFLAPVGRGAIGESAAGGERLFGEIGCAACHLPALQTGPNSNPVFHNKSVPLYSDLLLHDVGTGDGIEQAAARGEEIRTPALWGLRFRRPLLHDGSAANIEAAIEMHAGEAGRVRERYRQLTAEARAQLLAFLKSL